MCNCLCNSGPCTLLLTLAAAAAAVTCAKCAPSCYGLIFSSYNDCRRPASEDIIFLELAAVVVCEPLFRVELEVVVVVVVVAVAAVVATLCALLECLRW